MDGVRGCTLYTHRVGQLGARKRCEFELSCHEQNEQLQVLEALGVFLFGGIAFYMHH